MIKKKTWIIMVLVFLISNFLTFYITNNNFEENENHENSLLEDYHQKQGVFDRVLYIFSIPSDHSLIDIEDWVMIKRLPVVLYPKDDSYVFVDISKDSINNPKMYYSRQDYYLDELREGDTLWISGQTVRYRDSTGMTPIDLKRIFVLEKDFRWEKFQFKKMEK